MKPLIHAIQRFFYPSCCLHCDGHIERGGALICPLCSHFFDFLDKGDHSPAACFEYYGAVATFVKMLKSKKAPYLAKTAASLLLLHHLFLNWPKPDLVLPVPCRAFITSNDHVHLMAKHLASLLKTEYQQPLRRRGGRPRQTELSREERLTLAPADFLLKDVRSIKNKNILIIDDVMTTGATLKSITTLLIMGGARRVLALVLAESLNEEAGNCNFL